MPALYAKIRQFSLTSVVLKYETRFLRYGLAFVFIWFGALKFFPGYSSAETMAYRTIQILTMGLLSQQTILLGLAVFECLIGIGFLFEKFARFVVLALFVHMAGTFSTLILYPEKTFVKIPFVATLEGQYIVKNIFLIATGLRLWVKLGPHYQEFRPILSDLVKK